MGSSTRVYVTALAPLFVCEACWNPIRNGGGYLCVDKEAAAELMSIGGGKVNWHIFHQDCDVDRSVSDYLIWTRKFHDTNDFFETIADLSERHSWFSCTNWQGLTRRVIADTNRYSEQRCGSRQKRQDPELRELRRKKYLEQMQSDPNDKRHGTIYGYNSIGCRCDRCSQASTNDQRERKQRERIKTKRYEIERDRDANL
jgi:hypothetical protein